VNRPNTRVQWPESPLVLAQFLPRNYSDSKQETISLSGGRLPVLPSTRVDSQ